MKVDNPPTTNFTELAHTQQTMTEGQGYRSQIHDLDHTKISNSCSAITQNEPSAVTSPSCSSTNHVPRMLKAKCIGQVERVRRQLYWPSTDTTTQPERVKLNPASARPAPIMVPEFVFPHNGNNHLIRKVTDYVTRTPRAVKSLISPKITRTFSASLLSQSPVAFMRSHSRRLSIGGTVNETDGIPKLLIRLTVNESKDRLTSVCGHGQSKGLRMNIFMDLCKVLGRHEQHIDIKDIREVGMDRTLIEIIVEPCGLDWQIDATQLGKRLTEQVRLNKSKVAGADGGNNFLASLISHIETDGHCTHAVEPKRNWLSLLVLVLVFFASSAAAWSSSFSLGAPSQSLAARAGTFPAQHAGPLGQGSLGKLPLEKLPRTRRPTSPLFMLEPLSTSIYGAAIVTSILSSKGMELRPSAVLRWKTVRRLFKSATKGGLANRALWTPQDASREGSLVRSTTTLVRRSTSLAAEKWLLAEESVPVWEKELLDDVAKDVMEGALDLGDLLLRIADRASHPVLLHAAHKWPLAHSLLDLLAPVLPAAAAAVAVAAALSPLIPLLLLLPLRIPDHVLPSPPSEPALQSAEIRSTARGGHAS